ncbi:MAG: phosphotransferase [Anaerolineae bacterium]|nr:phosphotransferase [Anaerolineae bacterium]
MQDFDIENHSRLRAYLIDKAYLRAGEDPLIQNLPGGVSNRTVLVKRQTGEAWVIKQALAKLRVKVDWFSDPSRIHREALGLSWLPRFLPEGTIPPFVFEDETNHIVAMGAVPPPIENWKEQLLGGAVSLDLVDQFGRILGGIHRGATLQRDNVQPIFADQTFFASLRLEPYYLYTAEQQSAAREYLLGLVHETGANVHTLVHGDYSPKNILVHNGRLVLLDHEVIHFGDPAFDLGFSLTHLLSKGHHLAPLRPAFRAAARAYWTAYLDALGELPWRAGLEARAVRHTLGCLLARVCGRSPLEYLTPEQREAQRVAVLGLMAAPPASVFELIDLFLERM